MDKIEWEDFEKYCFGFITEITHWTAERDKSELVSHAEFFLKMVKQLRNDKGLELNVKTL